MSKKPRYRYNHKLGKWIPTNFSFKNLTLKEAESVLKSHGAFIATN